MSELAAQLRDHPSTTAWVRGVLGVRCWAHFLGHVYPTYLEEEEEQTTTDERGDVDFHEFWSRTLRSELPASIRDTSNRWEATCEWMETFARSMHNDGSFYVALSSITGAGLGVFARKHLVPGDYSTLQGFAHLINARQHARLRARNRDGSVLHSRNVKFHYLLTGLLSFANHQCTENSWPSSTRTVGVPTEYVLLVP